MSNYESKSLCFRLDSTNERYDRPTSPSIRKDKKDDPTDQNNKHVNTNPELIKDIMPRGF